MRLSDSEGEEAKQWPILGREGSRRQGQRRLPGGALTEPVNRRGEHGPIKRLERRSGLDSAREKAETWPQVTQNGRHAQKARP